MIHGLPPVIENRPNSDTLQLKPDLDAAVSGLPNFSSVFFAISQVSSFYGLSISSLFSTVSLGNLITSHFVIPSISDNHFYLSYQLYLLD